MDVLNIWSLFDLNGAASQLLIVSLVTPHEDIHYYLDYPNYVNSSKTTLPGGIVINNIILYHPVPPVHNMQLPEI